MISKVPVDQLYQTTVVTADAKAMARGYARFFGITHWKVVNHDSRRLTNQRSPAGGDYSFLSAEGVNPTTGLRFQLVQPTGGMSVYEEFLVTRGPGIHSLWLTQADEAGLADITRFLAAEGIGIAQAYQLDEAADVVLFDTRAKAGGWMLKVVRPRVADWQDAVAPDETWDFSNEVDRPEQAHALAEVPGIRHFGVVVENLQETLRNLSRLFGKADWMGFHWSSQTGSLIDCTNNGKDVDHAYVTAMGNLGENATGAPFGLEVIQPTFGPSHYKEDFLQPLGPGIHHIDVDIPFAAIEEFVSTNFWWREIGATTCMSGWLLSKNVAYPQFAYQDTRRLLGFVTEIHPGRQAPLSEVQAPPFKPHYAYQFPVAEPA